MENPYLSIYFNWFFGAWIVLRKFDDFLARNFQWDVTFLPGCGKTNVKKECLENLRRHRHKPHRFVILLGQSDGSLSIEQKEMFPKRYFSISKYSQPQGFWRVRKRSNPFLFLMEEIVNLKIHVFMSSCYAHFILFKCSITCIN